MRFESDSSLDIARDSIQGVVLGAPVEVIRIAERLGLDSRQRMVLLRQPHKPILVRKWQRPQQDRIHQAENSRSRAYAQGERQNRGDRKSVVLRELPEGKSCVRP